MSYPYKYIVKIWIDDAYSQFIQEYSCCDIHDAMKKVDPAKKSGYRVAIYHIVQHENFK